MCHHRHVRAGRVAAGSTSVLPLICRSARPVETPGINETPLSLLDRLRHSPDEISWRRLTDLYLPLLQRWLRQQHLPPADADDLTQDILLVIVRELNGFEHSGRTGAFRAWLRMITVHRMRGYWRSRQTGPDQALADDLDQLADDCSELAQLWDREHDEFIARRLMELIEPEFSRSTWYAFRRQTVDGLTASQAAAELGVSANSVLVAKSRVLRRLRQEAAGLLA
jgi:RNA polymerase sigma factor (sigma-70 family)